MKIRQLVSGVTFALLTVTLVSSNLDAQDRRRSTRDDSRRNAFTVYNGMLQGSSNGGRMGVFVDQHQPTRYDESGARLTGVTRNSAAGEAGLEEGDIITSINGQSLTAELSAELEDEFDRNESLPAQRLMAIARELEPGDPLDIEYVRDGESASVSFEAEAASDGWMVLGGVPTAPDLSFGWNEGGEDRVRMESQLRGLTQSLRTQNHRALERSQGMLMELQGGNLRLGYGNVWASSRVLNACPSGSHMFMGDNAGCLVGTEIREIEAELGSYFDVDGGLLVVDAAVDNPLGLEAGDVILAIGGREISSFRRLRRLITSYEAGESITLTVMRDGSEVELEGTLD